MDKVVLASQDAMCCEEIRLKLEKMLEVLEEEGTIIPFKSHVVIKPNLVSARKPHEAATSHPEMIEAVIQICLNRGCKVTIAESPSGKMEESRMKMIYSKCGLWPLQEKYPIDFNLSDAYSKVELEGTGIIVPVLNPFLEADLIINCCKMKSHGYTLFTGAVKNCFGMIPGLKKAELHARFSKRDDFCKMIAKLCKTIHPELNIMDAIEAMHKEGPTNGEVIHLGRLLMSRNAFALDEAALQLINKGQNKTPVQAAAIKAKDWDPKCLVRIALDKQAEELISGFQFPKHSKSLFSLIPIKSTLQQKLSPYPTVDRHKCIGCNECVKDCPAKTIRLESKKAKINKRNCMRCYCCQEVCPQGAIYIR